MQFIGNINTNDVLKSGMIYIYMGIPAAGLRRTGLLKEIRSEQLTIMLYNDNLNYATSIINTFPYSEGKILQFL